MCGLAGIIAKQGQPELKYLRAMLDLSKHRGPDDNGVYLDGAVGLGHNRLAIIDLTAQGHQPFFYQDRYALVFNGEIYNYLELRQELAASGYKFLTQTDTEVIPAAYDHWGAECLRHFNGMWAFALYDKKTKTVFAARDRFGIKPFYYYNTPEYLAFASEIKQFTCLAGWQAVLNQRIALEFLVFTGLDHSEDTFFQGVKQLRGGCYLTYALLDKKINIKCWYDLEKTAPAQKTSKKPEEIIDGFAQRFSDAVLLRLRSDVKVGSCLSGGLDSSSIVMTINQELRRQNKPEIQETVSACNQHKEYDEQEFIDEVLNKSGVGSHKIYTEYENLLGDMDKIIWHQDEPFDSTPMFAQWSVFAEAKRQGLTVMLDGQGSDEQLAGYHEYYGRFFTGLIKRGRFFLLFKELKAYKKMHGYTNYNIIRQLANNLLPYFLKRFFKKLRNKERLDWLNVTDKSKSIYEANFGSIRKAGLMQTCYTNLPRLLHYEDRNSMAHSIEARVPFLDYRLAEYICALPDECKIKDGYTKYVLRAALRGVLPEKIRLRTDKKGFITPEEIWFKDNAAALRVYLLEAVERSGGLFNNKIVDLYDNFIAGKIKYDPVFWRVIAFGRWQKLFQVQI
jgi:asparagine synthase (glutamine-hydrolysing)